MAFLIKAQESKSPYWFPYINFNVGSENLYGYIKTVNKYLQIVHFAIFFLFSSLCFNAMISKNEIHLDYSWE